MRIVLVNVDSDDNRGACALTWAALDLLRRAFPGAGVTIMPRALARVAREHFRHTKRRHPDVEFVAPAFDGGGRTEIGKVAVLTRQLADVFLARARRGLRISSHGWIDTIRNADLVVVVGGVSLHTAEGSVRGDFAFLARLLPMLAARASRKPLALLGAQVGPFFSVCGALLSRRVVRKAHAVVARDAISRAEVTASGSGEPSAPRTGQQFV